MEELLVSVGASALIIGLVAVPWFIFCHFMLTYGDFNDFKKRKH